MVEKSYSELIKIDSFEDRILYLSLNGNVGEFTFNGHRYLNQILYKTPEWKKIRRTISIRDNGFDLGHPDYEIVGNIYIHHINPITPEDILQRRGCVFDPENLISCSFRTHNEIHYSSKEEIKRDRFVIRTKNDTCPWR